MNDNEKTYRFVISCAVVLVLGLYMTGRLAMPVYYGLLIVLWAVIAGRETVKFLKAGNTMMAVSSGVIGIGMIILLVWRLRSNF